MRVNQFYKVLNGFIMKTYQSLQIKGVLILEVSISRPTTPNTFAHFSLIEGERVIENIPQQILSA